MRGLSVSSRKLAERLGYGLAALLVGWVAVGTAVGAVGEQAPPTWTEPAAMTLRRFSAIDTVRHEPTLLSNLDCDLLTYRSSGSGTMQTGCFTQTAFGLLDSDNGAVIFNGSDEGLPLLPYSAHQVLAPWPKALDLLTLDAAPTGGSYVNLYKNPLVSLSDQRDARLIVTAKQLTRPPDLTLRDSNGQPLVINSQTLAFSYNGSWLAAESLNGSFIRVNLATLDVTAFAPAFGSQGSPALLKSQVAVSGDGRYAAIANDAASSFKVYDLDNCSMAGTSGSICRSYDYWPFIGRQISNFRGARHLRFLNDGLISFEVRSGDPTTLGTYALAPTDKLGSLIDYLGLGDSYTSGEGAYDYLAGTDTPDNMCHLSTNSYPLLLAGDLFGRQSGHSIACSGATIKDVGDTSNGYRGQVRGIEPLGQLQQQAVLLASVMAGFRPGYVAQQTFVRQYQPAIMTVSVGGDDVGFGDMVRQCVIPHVSRDTNANTCYGTYEDRLEIIKLVDRTVLRWTALDKQLMAEAPGSRLYVVGYPDIVTDQGNCASNVHLNKNELEFAEEMIDYLNGGIERAATQAGAIYVDISRALVGHRLCETAGYDVAVNGLTAGKDAAVLGLAILGKESYHPNALGQALIEQAILRQTGNLTAGGSRTGMSSPNPAAMLNAPRTGRPVNNLVIDPGLTAGIAYAGRNLTISANGPRDGLKPSTVYAIRLDGSGGPSIGSGSSDAAGNLSVTISLPPTISGGDHTLDITGETQTGEVLDVRQPVYVPVKEDDTDGDGVANILDSCPYTVNGGRDEDSDGIDDACDGFIGSTAALADRLEMVRANLSLNRGGGGGLSSYGIVASQAGRPVATEAHLTTADRLASLIKPWALPSEPAGRQALPGRSRSVVNWLPWILFWAIVWLALIALSGLHYFGTGIGNRTKKLAGHLNLRRPVPKFITFDYNVLMMWVRKGFVYLLSLILLLSLVGLALSISFSLTVGRPAKVEGWLVQAKLYDHFAATIADQAQKSYANNGQAANLPPDSSAAVRQAAQAAFSPAMLQQDANAFLNSNYAWLEGKVAAPDFRIDLSQAKQSFAQKVGQYVTTRLTNLPLCSATQLGQIPDLQNVNPLSVACRPAGLDPKTAGTQTTQQLAGSGDFLSDPVITASTLKSQGNNGNRPYYQKLSAAPAIYRWSLKLPWLLGGLAALCALGIIFISLTRRRGFRRLAVVLLEVGAILIAITLVSDNLLNWLDKKVFNSSAGPLQQSLADFLHRLETQAVKIDFWFGVACLGLAVVLAIILWFTRRKFSGVKPPGGGPPPGTLLKPSADSSNPDNDSDDNSGRPAMPAFKQRPPARSNRPRPPRLIQ